MGGSESKALGKEVGRAAYDGDTAQVQALLAAKAPIDQANQDGNTPLMHTSWFGHIAPMELLLAAKARVDRSNKEGVTSLMASSKSAQSTAMELLLAAKAPVDQTNKYGETSLMLASMNGIIAPIELLLAAKARVDHSNKKGSTSLMNAIENGSIAPMELLLAANAPVDQTNKHGETALILASRFNDIAPVALLLAARANVHHTDKTGCTALDCSSRLQSEFEHIEHCELLESWSLLTPLMLAVVFQQSPQEIKALLHGGADPSYAVQLPSGTQTAYTLALGGTICSDFALSTICCDTIELFESSLTWSVESHNLFPPGFRRGVRRVCGLKAALDQADRQLSNQVWMIVIAHLPRNWAV